MTKLTIGRITDGGGIIHFLDNTHAVVNINHHNISNRWSEGDEVSMIRPKDSIRGTFHLHSTDEVFVDCAWFRNKEQIV
jgi:hypothetical protein